MSGESSKRSNLVDVTYQELHAFLSGHLEGTTAEHVADLLRPRLKQLGSISQPFGKPSDASRKKVESGSVTLRDKVVIRVEDADKEVVLAVSDKFDIDEVEALVLLRSFLYNEGLPAQASAESSTSLVEELLEAITPFYFAERLFALRALVPLYRANEEPEDPLHAVAGELLPFIVPDGRSFAEALLDAYAHKAAAAPPDKLARGGDARGAARWAKQNAKEQLVLLEVLFWTMWSYAACDGALVVRIFGAAYAAELGAAQANATLMLDEEGAQLLQDSAAVWMLIMLEVLELERIAEPGALEIASDPEDATIYTASPDALSKIHELVVAHQSSQYACIYLAWAFVLSRLSALWTTMADQPDEYRTFFAGLQDPSDRSYSDGLHMLMARSCLNPEVGLFQLMLSLLTTSPLFVTSVAWRTGSTITEPNAVAFRSVFKGLVIALVELVPVELIPDFDAFVDVWIALFGRSESASISGICRQYWQADWKTGIARRAIFDVARSRFPVQFRPLVRLLRAMTATGFLDTDVLSTADHAGEGHAPAEDRQICNQHVFFFLDQLASFTQVISAGAPATHGLYEKVTERHSASAAAGVTYTNLRPVRLPGGSTLPARSAGRLLSGDGGEAIVVIWRHEHSGWKLLLEVLTDYVNRRRGAGSLHRDVSFGKRGAPQVQALRLEDMGVEMDKAGDEVLVMESLDLVRSVIQDDPVMAAQLLESLEAGDPVVAHTMTEAQPPDLVQLTTMILEDSLSRSASQPKNSSRSQLITSAMSVLSALLALPTYSNRVWLYIRSTSALFGSERTVGVASSVLAAERVTGHYTMTLALLHLVQQLFYEASSSLVAVLSENPRLQQIKEDVLLRAARFVHAEIWVEHMGWKYAQLGDRFEIGRRVSTFFAEVLTHSSLTLEKRPFAALSQAVADALLFKATPSTITPLVMSVTSAGSILGTLYSLRRHGDARRLIFLLQSHLTLTRIILNVKQRIAPTAGPCMLEQALCARGSCGVGQYGSNRSKANHINILAGYVKERGMGNIVPLEAIRVLHALCASLALAQPSPPTIVGHLSDPEGTVSSFVRIIQHPYDDAALRNAVWSFMSLAVDKEPALAGLFVTGEFRVPDLKGKSKAIEDTAAADKASPVSAMDTACDMLAQWKDLWDLNPHLLASVLSFLDAVWQHGLEHRTALEPRRKDTSFWQSMAAIMREEVGPNPDYKTTSFIELDGTRHSDLHEAVATHAYRVLVKSLVLHIIALDIGMHLQARRGAEAVTKPASFAAIEGTFKSEEQLTDFVAEAVSSAYDPALHDDFSDRVKTEFPALVLDQLQSQDPIDERTFGDNFVFSLPLLQRRLQPYRAVDDVTAVLTDELEKNLVSINLNLSLAHAQTALAKSWQSLLQNVVPFLRGESSIRRYVFAIAASISGDIASETRSGAMMAVIHNERLSLLLSLLEVAWFSDSDSTEEVRRFVSMVKNVQDIILNDAQPPSKCFLGTVEAPFHRTILQIIYFCAKNCRSLVRRAKTVTGEQRLVVASTLTSALELAINALRVTFDSARSRQDIDLDLDMELLVAVFEQCTRTDINSSTTHWLTICQESDVIRSSLELFVNTDVAGLSNLPVLQSRKRPLYAPHILVFHMALATLTSSAERLASAGVLVAYSNNSLTAALSAGTIDAALPELPNERSPAHDAYCTMLAVAATVVSALGRQNHFLGAEMAGFVQLYGEQIARALAWSVGDPLTLPRVEEMEQVVRLFYAIAESTPHAAKGTGEGTEGTAVPVLRTFSNHALLLLQQLNYALTHPNHLASLFEPVTAEERAQMDRDAQGGAASSGSDVVDTVRRPFLANLVHRLYRLTGSILATLSSISGAEHVLLGEQEDWPVQETLIVPHSKVILGEPASLGTLLELGNSTLDVLRHLSSLPASRPLAITAPGTFGAAAPLSASATYSLDGKASAATARRTLETALLYAVTQLAMWVSKPDFDGHGVGAAGAVDGADADMDDAGHADGAGDGPGGGSVGTPGGPQGQGRKGRRESTALTERVRRGMTGEMASDLLALLAKAGPVLTEGERLNAAAQTGKAQEGKDKDKGKSESVDLARVLAQFLQERVIAAA